MPLVDGNSLNFYPFLFSKRMADLLLHCVSFFPFCFVRVPAGEAGGCEDVEEKWERPAIHSCICGHTHMQRPEVGIRCLSQLLSTLFLEAGSLTQCGTH